MHQRVKKAFGLCIGPDLKGGLVARRGQGGVVGKEPLAVLLQGLPAAAPQGKASVFGRMAADAQGKAVFLSLTALHTRRCTCQDGGPRRSPLGPRSSPAQLRSPPCCSTPLHTHLTRAQPPCELELLANVLRMGGKRPHSPFASLRGAQSTSMPTYSASVPLPVIWHTPSTAPDIS